MLFEKSFFFRCLVRKIFFANWPAVLSSEGMTEVLPSGGMDRIECISGHAVP